MLATTIGIQTRFKAYVRAVVVGDDCLCAVAKKLRLALRLPAVIRIGIDNIEVVNIDMQLFESIGRTPGSSPSMDRLAALRSLLNHGREVSPRHDTSSHEHISLSRCFQPVGEAVGFPGTTTSSPTVQPLPKFAAM